jgi:hypothetical protein
MTGPGAAPPEAITLVFRPLHKRAFGMAIGIMAAMLVFLVTSVHLLRQPEPAIPLGLLAEYFAGYTVSWPGALIGAGWAGFTGFMLGWFLAFCRNFLLALMILVMRSRAELAQTRDLLDHI